VKYRQSAITKNNCVRSSEKFLFRPAEHHRCCTIAQPDDSLRINCYQGFIHRIENTLCRKRRGYIDKFVFYYGPPKNDEADKYRNVACGIYGQTKCREIINSRKSCNTKSKKK